MINGLAETVQLYVHVAAESGVGSQPDGAHSPAPSYDPTSREGPYKQHDDGRYQQDVEEPTRHVASKQAEGPKNDQDDSERREHV